MGPAKEYTVQVGGEACRVWEKGDGPVLGYLAGLGGLPAWTPVLERLAEARRVVVPSLPGQPGAPAFRHLDSHLDWLLATEELLRKCGLAGADLMAASFGGALTADAAAVWPDLAARLVLLAPLGLFDAELPVTDVWAQRPGTLSAVLCNTPALFDEARACPDGVDEMDWQITQVRALEAAARLLWPVGDTRLAGRLPRISAQTLIVWGRDDQVVPPPYAEKFAGLIGGETRVEMIDGAGHLADLDAPDRVAELAISFLGQAERA